MRTLAATGALLALCVACTSSRHPAAVVPTTTSQVVPTTAPLAGQCPTVPTRAEPRADRTIYHLSVDVDLDHNQVTGTVDATFTPDLATDRLVFRLWPNG